MLILSLPTKITWEIRESQGREGVLRSRFRLMFVRNTSW